MMDKVLEGFDEFADSFIDDIGIFSDTWEFHVAHLRAVFQSLREAKLVAKPSKCFVGYGELELLGHIAGSGSIKPVQDKVSLLFNSFRFLLQRNKSVISRSYRFS